MHSHFLPRACTLDNGDPEGRNATLDSPISPEGLPELGREYQVPARQGRAVVVSKGQSIRIINTHGTQVCDTWAFNRDDLSEFMSFEHVRAAINGIIPRVGDALVTNHRRPILRMTADTSPGIHDTLIAACDLWRYRGLGVKGYHDSCSDNLRMALLAIGLRTREVPQPFNVWMNIPVKSDQSIDWLPPVTKAGDYIDLRAEMDCVVVMSACPQDLIPINNLKPMDVRFSVN